MTNPKQLVTVELRFVSTDDAEQTGDRIREAVAQIVGREALEEFRIRSMLLEPKKKGGLRPVD
jgi:hypothetical protein